MWLGGLYVGCSHECTNFCTEALCSDHTRVFDFFALKDPQYTRWQKSHFFLTDETVLCPPASISGCAHTSLRPIPLRKVNIQFWIARKKGEVGDPQMCPQGVGKPHSQFFTGSLSAGL